MQPTNTSPSPRQNPGKRTVLITGCSTHGLGYALALAFHATGEFRVFATARDTSRMAGLKERSGGEIETLQLDVLDQPSIERCVAEVQALIEQGESGGVNRKGLACLVNNAGGGYNMPVSDISIPEAKALFDLNVWSYISVTQAFLPLLISAAGAAGPAVTKTNSLILNNTSVSSVEPTPHNSVYHASKAAAAMFSTHMRIELQPFHIRVVDLKTGCVHSHFHANHQGGIASLPSGNADGTGTGTSLYMPVREETENAMRNAFPHREDPDVWAESVVRDVTRSWNEPPLEIWRGTGSWRTWFANTFFPVGWWDESWRRAVGLDLLSARLVGMGKGGRG
ncbi:uncharacterized protein A1O9_03756 [Exophiala aquamarina CBS 119918]|uniref:Alcohol dehydrogenase n=1 Tax=Exophiala aquamarina CBS 119918 TaxID=1182545 RepID=A0A072PHX7_9EURO|nr:uncharacterized protein A1O9_03756 [Exophiala aquamarina CBS 119918]KEF58913.1 hypothetical protein A1O9_03756 [Exophiala aquamarina CBS 119918]